jgi:hypothetical protein
MWHASLAAPKRGRVYHKVGLPRSDFQGVRWRATSGSPTRRSSSNGCVPVERTRLVGRGDRQRAQLLHHSQCVHQDTTVFHLARHQTINHHAFDCNPPPDGGNAEERSLVGTRPFDTPRQHTVQRVCSVSLGFLFVGQPEMTGIGRSDCPVTLPHCKLLAHVGKGDVPQKHSHSLHSSAIGLLSLVSKSEQRCKSKISRARTGYEPQGRQFESLRARHKNQKTLANLSRVGMILR